ncbi:MAG: hypothetical protein LBC65_05210 [Oscillospiraceae bacterium]|jgi:hypothetical protein|nr:hypothetical protein [Oscillospiraceae bacterium]
MKSKTAIAIVGVSVFAAAFTAAMTLPLPKFGGSGSAHAADNVTRVTFEESYYDDALLIASPDPVELFTIRAEGGSLNVFNRYGELVLTESVPGGLPQAELAKLITGVTVIGHDAMLRFIEDFAE